MTYEQLRIYLPTPPQVNAVRCSRIEFFPIRITAPVVLKNGPCPRRGPQNLLQGPSKPLSSWVAAPAPPPRQLLARPLLNPPRRPMSSCPSFSLARVWCSGRWLPAYRWICRRQPSPPFYSFYCLRFPGDAWCTNLHRWFIASKYVNTEAPFPGAVELAARALSF